MIIRNFKIREKRKNELFLAQKEKQQIRELSEMKMNFFMNLSHEFRTPLTLIISPLQNYFLRRISRRMNCIVI